MEISTFFHERYECQELKEARVQRFVSLLVFVSGSSNSLRISEVFRLSQMHDRFRSYTNAYNFY